MIKNIADSVLDVAVRSMNDVKYLDRYLQFLASRILMDYASTDHRFHINYHLQQLGESIACPFQKV